MIMKRIKKVENILEVTLRAENGEDIVLLGHEIESSGYCSVGNQYFNKVIFKSGYELLYRDTERCTFYELKKVNEEKKEEVVEMVEEMREENYLENITVENSIVVDLYDKNIVQAFSINNEEYEFFGFIDDYDVVYIPFKPVGNREKCFVCELDDIKEFITERCSVKGKLLFLTCKEEGRYQNNVVEDKMFANFAISQDGEIRAHIFNKQVVDCVVKLSDGRIGFVDRNKVYSFTNNTIDFFSFKTVIIEDYNEDTMRTVYKRYVPSKKTKGITDIDFKEDIFAFFK